VKKENDPINDMIAEAGLDAAEYADVAQALSALRAFVPEQAPAPSVELAALLSGGVVTSLALVRSRKRRIALASSALAATVVVGTGVAAASNTLPEGAQRFLNHFSHKYLPFEFPSPDDRGDESSPSQPGERSQDVSGTTKTDNGNPIGGGLGEGKTDNLGLHNGPNNDPAKPDNPVKSNNGQNPGQGQSLDNGTSLGPSNGAGKPETNPTQAATPTAAPKPTEPPVKANAGSKRKGQGGPTG
jgi:hypothetical protein